MKIVAVVPMKLNNNRLQQKNTKRFKDGNPLCTYILNTLLQCKFLEDIYVYCSNSEICNYIPKGVKFIKRSESLDQDTTKMNEVLYAFTNVVHADIYLMTHATAPFISTASLERGINAVMNEGYDSAFTVKKLQDFIWKDGKPFNYSLNNIPRTQDIEPLFVETSGFYIYKREVINKYHSRIGKNSCMIEIGEIESCDIDEFEDFLIADAIHYYLSHGGVTVE